MTTRETELLQALRQAAEGEESDWREVYLDNVPLRGAAPARFAGLTGSLTKRGLYREIDDAWAMVRMS